MSVSAAQVLELLENADSAISGEEMARQLKISRNSVWKAIQSLRRDGYEIEAGTNRGYKLLSPGSLLTAGNLRRRLSRDVICKVIEIRDSVTSTNTVLKELAESGKRQETVLIARQQTAGKGRLGRSFLSPKGTGLYMSLLLYPAFSAEESLSITTAAAVAVAGAAEAVTGREAGIKWVNDVYLDGYKICGILTEASVDFESGGLQYAVLGIGVNIREPAGGFPESVRDIAGALYRQDPPPGTECALAAEILNRFFTFYKELSAKPFLEEYKRRSLLTGMRITFSKGREQYAGVALGVDDDARLIVRLDDGTTAVFSAGEVVLDKTFLEQLRKKRGEETL